MSRCNLCKFCDIQISAKRAGNVLIKRTGWHGGIDVFEVPQTIKVKSLDLSDQSEDYKKYWRCWYMELPAQCEC